MAVRIKSFTKCSNFPNVSTGKTFGETPILFFCILSFNGTCSIDHKNGGSRCTLTDTGLIAKNERVIIKKSLLTDGESVVETCTFIIPDTEDSDEGDWILSEFGGSIDDQGVPKVVSRKLKQIFDTDIRNM